MIQRTHTRYSKDLADEGTRCFIDADNMRAVSVLNLGTIDEPGHADNTATLKLKKTAPGFAPIFPDICYHLTHYKPAAADIPVASDNPAHYADAIRYNARTPLQGSLLPLTRLVWA